MPLLRGGLRGMFNYQLLHRSVDILCMYIYISVSIFVYNLGLGAYASLKIVLRNHWQHLQERLIGLLGYLCAEKWLRAVEKVQMVQIQSTCHKKHTGSGNNICKLHENVNHYELEIDAELEYENDLFLFSQAIFLLWTEVVFPQASWLTSILSCVCSM